MRIYVLTKNNMIVAYVASYEIALESLKISYSAWPDVRFEKDIISITVHHKGWDPTRYVLEPITLLTSAQHL